jgi:hypothetical protein
MVQTSTLSVAEGCSDQPRQEKQMKRTVLFMMGLALMLMMLGTIAHAQQNANVTGTWELTQPGRNGNQTSTLTIEQKGADLTGNIKGAQGDPAPLVGKVEGNSVTFTVTRQGRRGEVVQEYKGTFEGGLLKGTVAMGQNNVEWSAKKTS